MDRHQIRVDKGKLLLGIILNKPEAWTLESVQDIKEKDLAERTQRMLWRALEAVPRDIPLSLVSVSEQLLRLGDLPQGIWAYMDAIQEQARGLPSRAAAAYARELRQESIRDWMLGQMTRLQSDLQEQSDPSVAVATALEGVRHLDAASSSKSHVTLAEAIAAYEARLADGDPRVSTGLTGLDEILNGGLEPGRVYCLAGRPGMGKSAVGLHMAVAAAWNGAHVAFWTGEMPSDQVGRRVSGWLPAHVDVTDVPMYINDRPRRTAGQLESWCRRIKASNGLELLVLDYLQIMRYSGENNAVALADLANGIKGMAIALGIPVVMLAQLNRLLAGRANPRPTLTDLRGSGGIEEASDVVILLHRSHYYDDSKDPERMDAIVAKNRDGRTGDVRLTWVADSVQVQDYIPDGVDTGNGYRL